MLGFFSKLFKSKTPAQDPQTQPENENTAAESAQAVDTDAADVDTAEQGQPENGDATENVS